MEQYELELIVDGFLVKEEIDVVRMPRARFLKIVDDLLAEGAKQGHFNEETAEYEDVDYGPIAAEIRPVAETMIRFPMGTWINSRRGCGCIIGEYIVATGEIDRHNLAVAAGSSRWSDSIEAMLKKRPNGDLLRSFGEEIDQALRNHLNDVGVNAERGYCEDPADIVQAIEITD